MKLRPICLLTLAAAICASAFAAALLFAPGFDAAVRWRLHLEERGYGSFAARLHRDYLLRDLSAGEGRVLLVGDSHALGLDAARLGPLAVNFGIGGDTMSGAAARLGDYQSARKARAVVLIAGYNDLRFREPRDVAASFAELRAGMTRPLYAVSVMPVRGDAAMNRRIAETDDLLRSACSGACRFIDVASRFAALDAEERELLYLPDGLHLTPFGYEQLLGAIMSALCRDGVYPPDDNVCA